MRIGAVVLAGVLLLSGCAAEPRVESPATVACLVVNAESVEALRVGVKAIQNSNDVGRAAAIKAPGGDSWLVAAEVTGPGMEPEVGVWATVNDPTSSPSNAYQSVDGIASAFSDYVKSPTFTVTSDGVDEVRSCVD